MNKEKFMLYYSFVINTLVLFILVFGGIIFADSNGVWNRAEDIQGGVFGNDEQDVSASLGYIFKNQLTLQSNLLLTNSALINCNGKLITDSTGKVICGIDNIVNIPTCTENQYLSADGSTFFCVTPHFKYTNSITNIANYNLRNTILAAGWDGVQIVDATITITGYIYSSDVNTAAFSLGGSYPSGSKIKIINYGYIVGKGGNGGTAGDSTYYSLTGQNGGDAMSISYPISLDNTNGYIYGGGGGGGGGAWIHGVNNLACGGSGGGGKGYNGGSAGLKGICYSGAYYPDGTSGTAGSFSDFGLGGSGASQWGTAGNGGRGGDFAENGQNGGDGNCETSCYNTVNPGGIGGIAGKAINVNSNAITWLGGNNPTQVKGIVG